MKSNNGVSALIVLVIIAGLILLGAFGIPAINMKPVSGVRTGIDIQGGISVTLEAADGFAPTQEQLDAARVVIESRLDAENVFDRNVTLDSATRRILVEIPYKSNEGSSTLMTSDYQAQQTVVDYIGQTANLTFRPVDSARRDAVTGDYEMLDEVLVSGARVADARQAIQDGGYVITLKFDAEGARQFAEATQRLIGQPIAIFMDNEMLMAPTVQSVISDGNAVITGQYTLQTASRYAAQIRSGAMPFKLEAREMTQITPLLGEGALDVTIRAGIIAFLLVFLYMVLYYRLPGFVAMAALVGMMAATLVIMAVAQITLTLPGIAGIILSIGMSIDANVIISERIREEIQGGRTIKAAIDAGFKNAFTAIFDSNVTTLISAVVLYFLGSGSIKGFAVTLALGVLLSFVSAITVSRVFLKFLSDLKFARAPKLYGVSGAKA
ncbi:MAG: protein translocase subunit SecD [Clostridiales bacterium]|jgi:preprotein translocase subunit SecD|nr:protein translocase subunit SecD [Clostridiales bacterium]